MLALSALAILFSLGGVTTAPTVHDRRSVTTLSASELSGFAPYTQFARAAYCPTSKLAGWNCGEACKALPGFQPTLVGGDGNVVQIYFVGYWPTQNTVIVAHEGTDPTQFLSLLTDANILMDPLDTKLFPGVSSSVQVHDGFRNAHALTATKILAEVKRLMTAKNTQSVTVVGHSLGGALAELDALYLSLNLPAGTAIKSVTYGTPRVGNAAFASLLDSRVTNLKRVNNKRGQRQYLRTIMKKKTVEQNIPLDLIPIVPGRFLGFAHGQGEVHILGTRNAVACSGQDNAVDAQCQIKTVPTIFDGYILDHLGPYEEIYIGTIFCT
ncbi:Lipase [Hypsizygus marmoreus]|uniref:Lipase n=1 Tax=Hypsizygus marmoreus TaxID=39966 RepID=A0A369JSD6_HYPMA|nr:Lipase [Hypsizygus marmoreus]